MKKIFSLLGLVGGIVIILLGLLVLFGVLGSSDLSTGVSGKYSYDHGYAKFGADFYNYVSNNAATAAEAGELAVRHLDAIEKLIKLAAGLIVMSIGIFTTCYFGVKFAGSKECAAAPKFAEKAPETTQDTGSKGSDLLE